MIKNVLFLLLSIGIIGCTHPKKTLLTDDELISDLEIAANEKLIHKWYPLALDIDDGGFYSEITKSFKLGTKQNKMIVSQARHIWTNSKAAKLQANEEVFLGYAKHGFKFLRDHMWDSINGGFHNLVNKKGEVILNPEEVKTAYGNAFAIYGLAAYYDSSGDEEALELAKKTFYWLEEHSHDSIYKGYYQSLQIDGSPVVRTAEFPSTTNTGYKDQNSSIHLLEAFTDLYKVWPDPLLGDRLEELLILIRDTITTEKGYMTLFFEKDWTPISFKHTSKDNIKAHYYLDHVSFGHDVETAYLLLEASHALGGKHDAITLKKGKKMVDHAIRTGWDKKVGGFYDGGYYFNGDGEISIVNDHKNWWTQAEGLNSLLLFSQYYPEDPISYREHFSKLWNYTTSYLMDTENGGWYEWGIDKRPASKEGLKGHIWKTTYHNYRALINCKKLLEKDITLAE